MTLGIDPEHVYVFDAATGDALAGADRHTAEAVSAAHGEGAPEALA
jgi:hypothetical protein